MQGDDVGMGTYLTQHVDLSLGGEGIGSGHHNGKSDLSASFRIPRQIRLFTRAPPDQMIDLVTPNEERAWRKHDVHS